MNLFKGEVEIDEENHNGKRNAKYCEEHKN